MIVDLFLYGGFLGLLFAIVVIGLFYRYMKTSKLLLGHQQQQKQSMKNDKQNANDNNQSTINNNYHELTILLGSGGHTSQLSLMLKNFHFQKLNKLNILITSNDKSSQSFFQTMFKEEVNSQNQLKDKIYFYKVSRTNQVKQNYLTAVVSTLKSTFDSIKLIRNSLINTTHFVSNGPGTCVPFFFLFFVLNNMKITRTKMIFIQSWCRVKSISLSGKIVKFFADKFIVHWQQQKIKYPWASYQGKIL